jgi:hypothetical protein
MDMPMLKRRLSPQVRSKSQAHCFVDCAKASKVLERKREVRAKAFER